MKNIRFCLNWQLLMDFLDSCRHGSHKKCQRSKIHPMKYGICWVRGLGADLAEVSIDFKTAGIRGVFQIISIPYK